MRNLRSDHHGRIRKYQGSPMTQVPYVLPEGVWQGAEWKANATSLFFLSPSHLQPSATEINLAWALSIWKRKSFFSSQRDFPNYYSDYDVSFYVFLFLLCRILILHILQFLMLCPKSLSPLLIIWFFFVFLLCFEMSLPLDPPGWSQRWLIFP